MNETKQNLFRSFRRQKKKGVESFTGARRSVFKRCKHSCSLGFVKVVQLTSDTPPPHTHTQLQTASRRQEGLSDSVTQAADLFIFPSDKVPGRNSGGRTGLESSS